jgi:hypothetical protein
MFLDEFSPAPCSCCTAGRLFAGGDQLFEGITKISPAPRHRCMAGCPAAGCDQVLLLILAAFRGQISSDPAPVPRFSDRHFCGVFHWDFLCSMSSEVGSSFLSRRASLFSWQATVSSWVSILAFLSVNQAFVLAVISFKFTSILARMVSVSARMASVFASFFSRRALSLASQAVILASICSWLDFMLAPILPAFLYRVFYRRPSLPAFSCGRLSYLLACPSAFSSFASFLASPFF